MQTTHKPPFSVRSRVVRWLIPDIQRSLDLGNGLTLTASVKKHLGLFRAGRLAREVAVAEKLAGYVEPDAPIYDVGANIGVYTLVFAANRKRRVVSFEPGPTARCYLMQNVANNHLDNVAVHDVVLSDRSGTCRFATDEVTTATSHVAGAGEAGIEVRCAELDAYAGAENLPPPRLVKIDVEGHDEPVLHGMRKTLERHRPLVYVEGGERHADGRIGAMVFLAGLRYSTWDLTRQRRLDADTPEYAFLAVP